ncbi:hypothetical protein ACFFRR_007695 [Megaselia abdita]
MNIIWKLLFILSAFHIQESFCQTSSILYAIASKDGSVSATCSAQLKVLKDAIGRKDPWGMKASDSSAQKSPGFILGNGLWLGNRKGCLAAQFPLTISLAERIERNMKENLIEGVAPFELDFKVAHIRTNSPWQIYTKAKVEPILHLGLCLPQSCSADDALIMTKEAAAGGLLADVTFLEGRPEVLDVKDLNIKIDFLMRPSLWLVTLLFVGSVVMCFVFKNTSGNYIVRGFDFRHHIKNLYTIKKSELLMPVVKGFKTVLSLVVLITHVAFYGYYAIKDKASVLAAAEIPDFQIFAQMPVLVEAIFITDGFLSCNSFLSNEKLINDIRTLDTKCIILKYFKRIAKRYCR